MVELQATIAGKVQGVRFRDYVQKVAGEIGVVGFVRNNPDGTVYVLAQGEPDLLKSLVEYLYEGSVLSLVDTVSVDWATVRDPYSDFSIIS